MTDRLILASGSKARKNMLSQAGLDFEVIPADLDETSLIHAHKNYTPRALARILAAEKTKAVSSRHKDALVIGGDQIMVFDGEILEKAQDEETALQRLRMFSGKTHELISAVAVARAGEILWQADDNASLTMINLSEAEIHRYGGQAGDALTKTVGGYELEGLGIALFDKITGDYYTILGLPLLPLLKYLRQRQDSHFFLNQ